MFYSLFVLRAHIFVCLFVCLQHSWPKTVFKKWLNISNDESDYSADEGDNESDFDGEEGEEAVSDLVLC